MDENKKKALGAALMQIERQFGKGSVMRMGDVAASRDIDVVSTGSLGLDIALGCGGLPRGRVVEIYGPESSGKTTLTLQVIAEMQKLGGTAAFVDAEHALDPGYAEKIGVNVKRYPRDNGRWSFPQRIDTNGPFLRITSLKTTEIVRKIRDAEIPVKQSFFAGLYNCNALFYELLGYAKEQNLTTSIGFIHVPLLDSQDPGGMSLEKMVDAVEIAIQESLG